MIIVVAGVLSSEELAHVRSSLSGARFVDGRPSAGEQAQDQKHVLQLERAGDSQREVGELVARALLRHPKVQAAALPKSIRHPSVNRYEPGMHYGPHLDAPIMRGNVTTRTDLSVTVFLSEPDDYSGGELVIDAQPQPIRVKLAAGDAVLYSSGAIHHVAPVTAGARLVAVTWLQSMVQSAEQRRLLFDLHEAIATLEPRDREGDARLRLQATYDNLLRMWVDA